ncbi:MAG: HEPN domain-containing protein [Pseudomonadota bacterium]
MAKNYPKSDYLILQKKAEEHKLPIEFLMEEKAYDACVSTACLSLINYMDALSINLFGSDNKTTGHAQAPILLQQKLNQIGKSNFKGLANEINSILNLKNLAAYECRNVTKKDAKIAVKVLEEMVSFYNRNVKRLG